MLPHLPLKKELHLPGHTGQGSNPRTQTSTRWALSACKASVGMLGRWNIGKKVCFTWVHGKRRQEEEEEKAQIICQVRSARGETFTASLGILLWFFPSKPAGPKGFLVFLEINANKLEAVSETSTWNCSDRLCCTRKKIMFWMNGKLQLPCHQYSKWAILTLHWPWDKWQTCWRIQRSASHT